MPLAPSQASALLRLVLTLFLMEREAPSGPPSSLLSTSISATAIAAEKRPCMSSVLVAQLFIQYASSGKELYKLVHDVD